MNPVRPLKVTIIVSMSAILAGVTSLLAPAAPTGGQSAARPALGSTPTGPSAGVAGAPQSVTTGVSRTVVTPPQQAITGSVAPVTAIQNGFNTVDLQWNAVLTPGASYVVTGPGLPATGVATSATSLHLTHIPAGAGENFTVGVVRAGLPIGASSSAKVDVSPVLMSPPNLYQWGEGGGTDQTIDINFTNSGAISVRLFKQAATGDYSEVTISSTSADSVRYFDHNLNPGWAYNYKLLAKLSDGTEVWSNTATVTIPVANLQAVVLANPYRIHLTWNAFALDGDYTIQKLVPPAQQNYSYISDAAGQPIHFTNVLSYDDSYVGPNQSFYYYVCAKTPLGKTCAGGAQIKVQ